MILKDKTVLITGGTGALGRVVAERFLREGCNVASTYFVDEEISSLTGELKENLFLARADVSVDKDVSDLFSRVGAKYGQLHILVNIVGGFLPASEIRYVKTKDWDHMINMNLRSVFLCSREFLRQLGAAPYGRILSMAAMPALRPAAGKGPYAVSKSGVVMLTKILGEELKGSGITANAIAPSIIRTPANIASMPGEDHTKWVGPEEIAEMMIHLCSEKGNSVNGTVIPMFGGI